MCRSENEKNKFPMALIWEGAVRSIFGKWTVQRETMTYTWNKVTVERQEDNFLRGKGNFLTFVCNFLCGNFKSKLLNELPSHGKISMYK